MNAQYKGEIINLEELKAAVNEWQAALSEFDIAENTARSYHANIEDFKNYLNSSELMEFLKNLEAQRTSYKAGDLTQGIFSSYKKMLKSKVRVNKKKNSTEAAEASSDSPEANFEDVLLELSTVNKRLTVLNCFLKYANLEEYKLKLFKIQDTSYDDEFITTDEYNQLIQTAYNNGCNKIAMIIETLANTGIRVGELKDLTVESLNSPEFTVFNKNKERTISMPVYLRKKLKKYCELEFINSGVIFYGYNRSKRPDHTKAVSDSYIKDNLKKIAELAGFKANDGRFHPHNFRHYFAYRFFNTEGNNPVLLANILGHSNNQLGTTGRYIKGEQKDFFESYENMFNTHYQKFVSKYDEPDGVEEA